ncbi:uncharacterized protein E5676_scaffold1300G00070 [Cucumis melo var. makuwa]|uniref:Uncharacterized protein n=1 Tax=Cucumis melo var. makuwa TaxID=1194695 RepID=A0A5D3CBQ7_CUCMM|nr:uncharacterized protein E5676_scaffold1300G00070 [Cucumis melo var. makuwa]
MSLNLARVFVDINITLIVGIPITNPNKVEFNYKEQHHVFELQRGIGRSADYGWKDRRRREEGDEYHADDYGRSVTEDDNGVFECSGGIYGVEYVYEDFMPMAIVGSSLGVVVAIDFIVNYPEAYDESISGELIERKIKNALPGQGTVRMLNREEWEEIREVRPRTPFESKSLLVQMQE